MSQGRYFGDISIRIGICYGFILISLLVMTAVMAFPSRGKFAEYAEQYKPIREKVCSGEPDKTQLTAMTECLQQFKSSFPNRILKQDELSAVIDECAEEGAKDVKFEVDKEHRELVYLKCSPNFGQCLHRQLPRFRQPLPEGESSSPPPQPGPEDEQKIETLIKCEKGILNLA